VVIVLADIGQDLVVVGRGDRGTAVDEQVGPAVAGRFVVGEVVGELQILVAGEVGLGCRDMTGEAGIVDRTGGVPGLGPALRWDVGERVGGHLRGERAGRGGRRAKNEPA